MPPPRPPGGRRGRWRGGGPAPASPPRCGTIPSGGWRWRCSTSWPAGDCARRWWPPTPATAPTVTSAPASPPRGSHYVAAVDGDLTAHAQGVVPTLKLYSGRGRRSRPRYRTRPMGLREHALAAGHHAARQVTWREGSRGPMTSRFLALRVRPAGRKPTARLAADGSLPDAWLLAEWPPEAAEPTDYWLSDLPEDTPLPELVRLAKIRWRIEHDYRELKTGLGLDHFEGRTFTGWHRHVTLVTAAQLFLTVLRSSPKAATPACASTPCSAGYRPCSPPGPEPAPSADSTSTTQQEPRPDEVLLVLQRR